MEEEAAAAVVPDYPGGTLETEPGGAQGWIEKSKDGG